MTEVDAALAELTAISSQVQAAVLFDREGKVAGSTLPQERAARLASAARSLLDAAEQVRTAELTQLEAATAEGSLFVVREGDQVIAATAAPDPTSGLVFYDLKRALRGAAEKPKPKPKPKAKAKPKPKAPAKTTRSKTTRDTS